MKRHRRMNSQMMQEYLNNNENTEENTEDVHNNHSTLSNYRSLIYDSFLNDLVQSLQQDEFELFLKKHFERIWLTYKYKNISPIDKQKIKQLENLFWQKFKH